MSRIAILFLFLEVYRAEPLLRTCEPIKVEICKGLGYNVTGMPNLSGNDLQQEAEYYLTTFSPLIQYGCSSQLKLFLCSVYVPMCTEKVANPIGPCRGLCENVRSQCYPVLQGFGFPWPDALNCSRFPVENNHQHMCMEGPQDMGVDITAPVLPAFGNMDCPPHHDRNDVSGPCVPLCDANYFFDPAEKRFAEVWVAVWAVICFVASLVSALTLCIGGGRVKARPLVSLALCYCFVSAGWLLRIMTSRSTTSCISGTNPGEIQEDGLANANCAFVFLLIYYFGMAGNAWWASLCAWWVAKAGLSWPPEKLRPLGSFLHIVAWGFPAAQTVGALVKRDIDTDELTDGSLIYAPITNEVTDFLETEKENKISEGSVESKSTKLPSSTFDSGRIWSRNATLQLIHLYSQHQQQFASTTLRNDAVWDLIKDKMEHEGFRYSSVQCKDRFKYLKIRYGKKIYSMRTTGASCIKFEFFDEMDQLFGKKPNFNPPIIASSSRRTVESSTNGTCYVGNKNSGTLLGLVLIPQALYLTVGVFLLILGTVHIMKKPRPMAAAPLTGAAPRKESDILGALSTLYAIPTACVMASICYEYNNRDEWLSGAEKPALWAFLLKHLMSLFVGVSTIFWLWSTKTATAWKSVFRRLGPRKQPPVKCQMPVVRYAQNHPHISTTLTTLSTSSRHSTRSQHPHRKPRVHHHRNAGVENVI